MTGCISHQSSHTGKLFDLLIGTTGSGVSHHEDVVVLIKTCKKCLCKLIIGLLPGFNNLFVTLFLCDKTTFVVLCDTVNGILSICLIISGFCGGTVISEMDTVMAARVEYL